MGSLLRIAFLSIIASSLWGIDLGIHGQTFPIEEENLITYLQEKVASLPQEQIQEKIQKHYRSQIEHPKTLNLKKADEYRTYHFDPTITLKEDITDGRGAVVISKGMKYNPLIDNELNYSIYFLDGSDLESFGLCLKESDVVILTSGSPLKAETRWKRPIYFDQLGKLTTKFGIQSVPAKVTQEGLYLKIEEIPIEQLKGE